VATVLTDLGSAEIALGKLERARAHLGRALAIRERTLGPRHPDYASTLAALGELAQAAGRPDEAERDLSRALAIRSAALGEGHADTLTLRQRLQATRRAPRPPVAR
jgi:tetratricopeptide (TPR) repeat protein